MTQPAIKAEPRRDRWGRYIIPDPETGKDREWTRATTVSGVLPDRYNLERWGERMVAFGLAQREDLLLLAQSVQDPQKEKDRLNKIAKQAKDAARAGTKANIGTAIHTFTELLDNGAQPKIPAAYLPDIRAYQAMQERYGIKVLATEQIVLHPGLGVAGTFDREIALPGYELPVILDVKTGGTVDFSHLEHAVQLAIYANAPYRFDPASGEVEERGPCERGIALIVHLPAGEGKCTVHELDIAKGWQMAQIAKAVYDARRDKTMSRPFKQKENVA